MDEYLDERWLDCTAYPGYQISNYGRVRRLRKQGYEMVLGYRDESRNAAHPTWVYMTIWKNFQPHRVPLRKLLKDYWIPEIERMKAEKAAQAKKAHRYQTMIDGFNPEKTSAHAYMKWLRANGHKFRDCVLLAELRKKRPVAAG